MAASPSALPSDWPLFRGPGVVSHASAAALWGLPVLGQHGCHLTVRSGGRRQPDEWHRHRAPLASAERMAAPDGTQVTSPLRTVLDCGRLLPLHEAVAILDAALGRGLVTVQELGSGGNMCHAYGAGQLRRAVRLSDGRADSAQESVGRVALRLAGLDPTSQYVLDAGPLDHAYDLALKWARVVIDMQSRAHHSQWSAVVKDIEHLNDVNLVDGWKLVWSLPHMVLPDPNRFVRRVLETVVTQPGPRCAALRRRYVDDAGWLIWPDTTGRR